MPDPRFETLNIRLPSSSYAVHLGRGLLGDQALWSEILPAGNTLIVTDQTVSSLYLNTLADTLGARQPDVLVLPEGESQKSFETWRGIIDRLVETGALRDATLVALGGGVVGDLTGFAAATYMRGIQFIQVPTTLLAQVDASVGGKTGINHPGGKNLVGSFHQPSSVIIDTDTLETLPDKAFGAGMAEVIKYGAIRDAPFFSWLETHHAQILAREPQAIASMIARSVRNKAEVVSEDEKESGIRAILNFGHSFAHALETLTGYSRYFHGEAVSVGMVIATTLSEQRGICPAGRAARIRDLLHSFGLPVEWPAEVLPRDACTAMARDKKALSTGLRLILLEEIGQAVIDQGSEMRDIVRAIESETERAP
jgi:3-dehydroquinate synthase